MIEGYCTTWNWTTDAQGFRRKPGVPLSVEADELVQFHMSSDAPYTVTYMRLRNRADVFDPIPMAPPLAMQAGTQSMPPEPWLGCNWNPTFSLTVPNAWPSGIYAAQCVSVDGSDFYVVFIVRPASALNHFSSGRRGRFVFLASTNTWNAYNGWGGRFQYSEYPLNTPELSFERPNPTARPCPPYFDTTLVGSDPLGRLSYDSTTRTTVRADLWILTWLEDSGYEVDVFTDPDFHTSAFDPAEYAGLILDTHPEYWTLTMRDRLDLYLSGGGRLVYLGGNGLWERTEYGADLRVQLFRQGDPNHFDRWVFENQGRPPRAVLGVGFIRESSGKDVTGYRTRAPMHRFLRNTWLAYGDAFGESGLTGTGANGLNGKACGWEMDTSKPVLGSGVPPANCVVLAESLGHEYASQMVCCDRDNGFVFSVGSLIFGGSLVLDPILQQIVCNVLNECLAAGRPDTREIFKSDQLIWLKEGILSLGPTGPVPVPPHGPMLDILLGVVMSGLAGQISDKGAQTRVRQMSVDLIAHSAERARKELARL